MLEGRNGGLRIVSFVEIFREVPGALGSAWDGTGGGGENEVGSICVS